MEVLEALRTRRSIRSFKETPVPMAMLRDILELGNLAPTSCNRQLWKFVVVDKPTFQKKLKGACPTIAVIDAPIVIFLLYDRRYNREHHANAQSAAAAAVYMCLAAHEMGLGSLWMAGYGDEKAIKQLLGIPDDYEIMCAVTIGYSDESPSVPPKRPLESVVCHNVFSGEGPFPFSWKPKDWTFNQLQNLLRYAIRAKSPSDKFYLPTSPGEFRKEIDLVPPLKGRTLIFGPFSGNHLFELIRQGKLEAISVASYGAEINSFLEEKRRTSCVSGIIEYLVFDGKIPAEPGAFDHIFCAYQLERMPDPQPIVDEFLRVLRPGGRLYLFVSNRWSLFYMAWMCKQAVLSFLERRLLKFRLMIPNASMALRGPFLPPSKSDLRRLLRPFTIHRVVGIVAGGERVIGLRSPRACSLWLTAKHFFFEIEKPNGTTGRIP